MKSGYVLIAVVVALVVGFAVGTLTSDGGGDDESATTRSNDVAGEAGTADSTDRAQSPVEGGEAASDDDQGTELAPESANDPRPEAPDDVIGDRPGGGGAEGSAP